MAYRPHFAQLVYLLVPHTWSHSVKNVQSDRTIALTTRHFILIADIVLRIPKQRIKPKGRGRNDLSALRTPSVAAKFGAAFVDSVGAGADFTNAEDASVRIVASMLAAAASQLPQLSATAAKPWISAATIVLIDTRNEARVNGDRVREKEQNRLIKISVRHDRKTW